MRPPTAAPLKAPIPAPFSRVVMGPPAHPVTSAPIKTVPAIIPDTCLIAPDVMFIFNILLCQLDGQGASLFTDLKLGVSVQVSDDKLLRRLFQGFDLPCGEKARKTENETGISAISEGSC